VKLVWLGGFTFLSSSFIISAIDFEGFAGSGGTLAKVLLKVVSIFEVGYVMPKFIKGFVNDYGAAIFTS